MRFGLDKALGINQDALVIHARRAEVLAGNLANADTPGFKARDIDFKEVLQQVNTNAMDAGALSVTNSRHLTASGSMGENVSQVLNELKYRTPSQPSIDGNTVDPLREKSAFMENALLYQTNLQFLNGKIKTIKDALRSE